MCAILYRILREVLTEKIIFEQRPEGSETEKSSSNPDKYISGREHYYRDLVKGMLGEQKESTCGWGHRSIDWREWEKSNHKSS